MSTLREYEQALERDPTLNEPFLALRKAYRESGTWDKLVTLYELRAQALTDAAQGQRAVLPGGRGPPGPPGRRRGRRGRPGPRHRPRPRKRQGGPPAEAALPGAGAPGRVHDHAGGGGGGGRAQQGSGAHQPSCPPSWGCSPRRASPSWSGRSALSASQRQAEVTPEALKLVESARKIYRALGDFQSVVRLYELELSLTVGGQAAQRPAAGPGPGAGREAGRPGGGGPAAGRGGAPAPARRPGAGGAGRGLRQPRLAGHRRQGAGGHHLLPDRPAPARGRRRRQRGGGPAQGAGGRPRPRRGLASCWSRCCTARGRLADLDLYYRERVAEAVAPPRPPGAAAGKLEEKMDFLFKRAQLAEGDRQRPARGAAHLPGDRRHRAAGRAGVAAPGRAVRRAAGLGPAGRAAREAAGAHRGSRPSAWRC